MSDSAKEYVGISQRHRLQLEAAAIRQSILLCDHSNPPTIGKMSTTTRLLAAVLIGCLATAAARQEPSLNVPVHTAKDSRGISPCALGPSYWCRSERNQDRCGVIDSNVGYENAHARCLCYAYVTPCST